jgi:SPP1 gp7 family putative phage head morphogenesis protein
MMASIHRSVIYWLRAEYRKHPPAIAQDASPFEWMRRIIAKLRNRWMKQIEEAAPKLADYFATAVQNRSDAELKKILRDGGFLVKFTNTKAMQDVRAATIAENVSLIKSIPSRFFDQIEGIISRGYAQGYDLKTVTDELQHTFGVTRKRAAFISRDQASKLNSQLTHVRYQEAGIQTMRWQHSLGGKTVRYTHRHVMNGKEYDIKEGMFDPDPKVNRTIYPGTLINCRCIGRAVLPGITKAYRGV